MSAHEKLPQTKQRNPRTQAHHQRQAFWQIYFPLILFGVLVLIAIVLVILQDDQGASRWSDISLIYIISIMMIIFLVTVIFLVVSVIYTARLIKELPYFFFTVQGFFYASELRVKDVSRVAAEPFIRIRSYFAGARALRRK
jgi:hypothetical protein